MPSCGVRVSVPFVHCVKTTKISSPSGSHTILVFPHQTGWQYSDGNPPNWGVECRCGKEKSRFWAYLASVPAASAATCQVLSTGSPIMLKQALYSIGKERRESRKLWHIAGSKRRCWLPEKTTKFLWQEASTLRQKQQNSAFNCTQW